MSVADAPVTEAPAAADARGLTPFEDEIVALFTRAARGLSIPKSIGQIYGLLYASQIPLGLDEVARALEISRGSASQGLRWLRNLGAIRSHFQPGERRERFTAEFELRRLATGFLRGTAEPHLREGNGHLDRLDAIQRSMDAKDDRDFAKARITKLRRWNKFAHQILPLVIKVAERF
jgi:DNA-binding transcriptional regulator GbsR (MarR family)